MLSIGCPQKMSITFNGTDFDVTLHMFNNPTNILQTTFSFYEISSLLVLINTLKDPSKRNNKPASTKLNKDIVATLDFNQQTLWLIKDDFYTDINKLCLEVLKLQLSSALLAYTTYMFTHSKSSNTKLLQDSVQIQETMSNQNSTSVNETEINSNTNQTDNNNNNSTDNQLQLTDEQIDKIVDLCNLSVTVDANDDNKIQEFKTYLEQYIKELSQVSLESFKEFIARIKNYLKNIVDGKQEVILDEYKHFLAKPLVGDIYRKAQETTSESAKIRYIVACILLNEIEDTVTSLSIFNV